MLDYLSSFIYSKKEPEAGSTDKKEETTTPVETSVLESAPPQTEVFEPNKDYDEADTFNTYMEYMLLSDKAKSIFRSFTNETRQKLIGLDGSTLDDISAFEAQEQERFLSGFKNEVATLKN